MIRVVASTSGISAKAYFSSGLSRADYYTDEIIGKWHGIGAGHLGLSGEVEEKQFAQLIENRHPTEGTSLNPRMNRSRTVGWDINFHAPKSVSLAISVNGDSELLAAFREAAAETMADIETQTETRVRINGASDDRRTANLCWAEFVHLTSRPIGGIPDPHTHIHAYVFNTTFDPFEERWKAAKIKAARREMPLHQARFHARLALRAKELGYAIKRTRSGWELQGLKRSSIDKFSRRTTQIERLAEELNLSSDASKDKLGALTREGKRKGLTMEQLREAWRIRLTEDENEDLLRLKDSSKNKREPITAAKAIDHAIEKVFARDAVVRRSRLLAEAMRYGVGDVSPSEIEAEYQTRPIWEKNYDGDILVTHDKVLAEEIALVKYVRAGKGKHSALSPGRHQLQREYLGEEQQAAVQHVLHSNDQFIAIRGGAGTGKTTAMEEIVEAIEATGKKVIPLAPSADASRGTLRKAGFENADTVAQFLVNPNLQEEAKGQVVWVDEAGLLGTRDLYAITKKAGKETRFILTGDTRQHAPVPRGNSFRDLQRFAGLKTVEINKIRRQEPNLYREAVDDLSQRKLADAFLKLDSMGAIHEVEEHRERYEKLASDYVALSHGDRVPLVVSPTRAEGSFVTSAIREKLKENDHLKEEREFVRFRNLQWETAEKKESENYFAGAMIQYHQNGKGIKRGARFVVSEVQDDGSVLIESAGKRGVLGFEEAEKFQVFSAEEIKLAPRDRIRITRNGFSSNGVRHSNGNIRAVESFTKEGDIKLSTGAIISKEDGHWDYGYCTTSHASQGKSVRDVLIAQSSESLQASSQEQFYVSVSRGKQRVLIYTDDRKALQESVGISEKSQSALQLAKDGGRKWRSGLERELGRDQWRDLVKKKANEGQKISKLSEARKEGSQSLRRADRKHHTSRRIAGTERRKFAESISKLRSKAVSPIQQFRLIGKAKSWKRCTSLLRRARQNYQRISARKTAVPSPEKSVRKPSVKATKRVMLRRPVIRK